MTPVEVRDLRSSIASSAVDSSSTEVLTLRQLIDWQAEAKAEECFLLSPETGSVVTFRGLQAHATKMARWLHQLGLDRGDKVATLMDNGLFTAELFLGVMYGGFVSVPLNVRAGLSQLSFMVEHCDAKVVCVAQEYAALMTEVMTQMRRPVQVVAADVIGEVLAGSADLTGTLAVPAPEPGDVALLMYTSGSTGHPKAAVHTHRTILAGGRNSVTSHQLTAADRSLLVLPLYHINAECVTLVPTLLSAGSVVVPNKFSISHYWDWLDQYRCTWSAIVPTIVSQLLDWKDPFVESRGACFQRIRFLRSSSAPLAPSLHREFLEKFPVLLIQAMGSSEGGNIFSNPLPPGQNKIGSPGLPWGFEVRVINPDGSEVPQGEPGEMLVRGEALARNYYKEPDATAAAFDAEGWLHTGDLAYRDEDGYFFVVGRAKELIIKGGVNIAPRQIDDVLESHPAVLEAAAVGVPDRYLGEDVIAFVVVRAGLSCEERELLSFCESRLGHFKTPTRIHFTKDLPKGPSGKVQRLRLVEEAANASVVRSTLTLGRGGESYGKKEPTVGFAASVEATIAGVWTELLKVPQVGENDNFFAMGGDSLLAIQCVSRLRDKLAIHLTLTDFFEKGTIAELSALVQERYETARRREEELEKDAVGDGGQSPEKTAGKAIPMRDRTVPYELSPLQERLWFMEQLNPDVPVYNESEAVRLIGKLNVDALEQALNAVIARHETLRTTIQATKGHACAVVRESYQLRLNKIDLSGLNAEQQEAEVGRLLTSEPSAPYRLQEDPAIRATLIRLGPAEHVFILMMHHLICDWSSLGVLWRDVSALYRGFCHGDITTLPALPIQHGDYAVWRRQQLTEAPIAEDLAFWVKNLRGAAPLLELPADRPRPQMMSYRGTRKRFRISRQLTEALRHLSRQEKKSLFALFTAALDMLLFRYTGLEDILLGIPLADRDRPELQPIIGFLLQTHVLRTSVKGEMTFRELVREVQLGALKLYEHRSAPFDQVVRAVNPERTMAYTPLFQVMVNWRDRDQDLSYIGLEDLRVESLLTDSGICKFDLTLQLTDMGEEVWAEVEYSTDLFDAARIERMMGHYQTLLESAAGNPGQRLSELPLLTADERRQILVDWNLTQVKYPEDVLLESAVADSEQRSSEQPLLPGKHRLLVEFNQTKAVVPKRQSICDVFEEQVERAPGAIALTARSLTQASAPHVTWTYAELNQRADELALYLRSLGVGPEVLVAVCVERTVEMVLGLLAVLKAGGAYLPLDPAYPRERLAFILEDAQVPVVLTQRSTAGFLPNCQARFVLLDDPNLQSAIQKLKRDDFRFSGKRRKTLHLAYVVYTSGSTGRPKGVEICHRAVLNFLNSMRVAPGMTSEDTLLSVTTLSFDIFGLEIWLPLTTGARVVIAPEEVARDGKELAQLVQRSGATIMQATPYSWQLLLESGWEGSSSLKILCGGEAWSEELAAQLLPKCASLWNMYGPTETTIWSAVSAVEKGKSIAIGHPIANTQFYVVDSYLQPMPIGVPGELLIGGIGLARGYRNRPELTAERFIPSPFAANAHSRLYRTGDLVRYLADGTLEFVGRIDQQVKVRGFRIELGEIEAALLEHPQIKSCAVVARDVSGDKRLMA